jgi:hypothetical protein
MIDYEDDHIVDDALFAESKVYLDHPWAVAASWGVIGFLCGIFWWMG